MMKTVLMLAVFTAVSSAVGAITTVYVTDYVRKRAAAKKAA